MRGNRWEVLGTFNRRESRRMNDCGFDWIWVAVSRRSRISSRLISISTMEFQASVLSFVRLSKGLSRFSLFLAFATDRRNRSIAHSLPKLKVQRL